MNISSKQIQWVLDKATPEIILSKQSIALDSDNLTDTFTITTNSDGNLSVISNDDSIATVSLSGNTVTIEGLVNGSTTITVNVTENSNYIAGTKTLSVNVQLVSTTLNDNPWDTIKATIQSGRASSLWNVGDTKEVVLNGTIEGTAFANEIIKAKILGLDHNKATETNGKSSITFGIADTTGTDITLLGTKMNSGDNTTSGGWNGSYMRSTVCPAFYDALPPDLKMAIGSVTKYSDNNGRGAGQPSYVTCHYVTATTDKIFLLSEYEVFGTRNNANKTEQNYQQQYDYYKNGGSKIRYGSNGSASSWWLRSPQYSFDSRFCMVNNRGITDHEYTSAALGFAPGFAIVAD